MVLWDGSYLTQCQTEQSWLQSPHAAWGCEAQWIEQVAPNACDGSGLAGSDTAQDPGLIDTSAHHVPAGRVGNQFHFWLHSHGSMNTKVCTSDYTRSVGVGTKALSEKTLFDQHWLTGRLLVAQNGMPDTLADWFVWSVHFQVHKTLQALGSLDRGDFQ